MQLNHDDEFEAPALEWLYRETTRLVGALRTAGVPEAQVGPICHDVMGSLAYGHDSEPVTAGGNPYDIKIIAVAPDGRPIAATDRFRFHEYANSIVDQVLDNT